MSRIDNFMSENGPTLPLVREVDNTEWSTSDHELFDALVQHDRTDPRWLVIITAAATMIASEAISGPRDVFDLGDDFCELVEVIEFQLQQKIADAPPPCPSPP